MANFTFTSNTSTIGTTEFSVAQNANYSSGSPKTTLGYVYTFLDVNLLAAGDEFRLRLYEKVNAGTQRVVWEASLIGAQTQPIYVFPVLLLGDGWDATVKKIAGTDRSILFSVRQDTNDVNTATLTTGAIVAASFAANAITSTVLAASAIGASQIASAAITAAKFATDAIDANALKADAVTEIQSGLATSSALATVQSDTDDIQTRLPAALVGGKMSSDVGSWLATTVATPTVAGIPKVEISGLGTGAITASTFAANAITSTVIAASAIGASQIASAAITAAKFATDAIDANALNADAVTEIQSGLATSSALATVQSDTDDIQARLPAALISGKMSSDVGSWLGTTAATPTVAGVPKVEIASLGVGSITASTFATDAINANAVAASAVAEIQTGLATSSALATVQADTDDIQTRLPAALVGGKISSDVGSWLGTAAATPTVAGIPKVEISAIDTGAITASTFAANAITSSVIAASAITAAKFATDAIDANALKADAVTEIQAGLATSSALATAQTDLTTLTGRLTSIRAGLLDNLDAAVTTRSSATALATVQSDTDDIQTRLPAALVGGKISSDVGSWLGTAAATPTVAGIPKVEDATLRADYTPARAAALDNLDAAVTTRATAATAVSNVDYTSARATKIDDLDTAISTRASATAVTAIDSRLPAALDGSGNIKAAVQSLAGAALTAIADAIFNYVIESAPTNATTFLQRLRVKWSVFAAQASGLAITTAGVEHFRNAANTKDRATFTLATDGTRVPGSFDGT